MELSVAVVPREGRRLTRGQSRVGRALLIVVDHHRYPLLRHLRDLVPRLRHGGFSSTRETKATRERGDQQAPISAVAEAPRLSEVPWSPPASPPREGSTDDMITLPTCEASSPRPAPSSASPIAEAPSVQLRPDEVEQDRFADEHRGDAALDDQLRRVTSRDRGAADREDEHRYRHRQDRLAGLEGVEAEHRLQVQRDHEEGALDDERLAPLHHQPGPHPRDLRQRADRAMAPLRAP